MTGASVLFAHEVAAQVVVAPATPQVGSSNPATAEPAVARPPTRPCIVKLLANQAFADFNNKSFSYSPPAGCPGPWSKVVLTADFTVTAGRQYDRTAMFFLGGANLYFGTTAEPRAGLSPSWHVERDVTELSALLTSPQAGTAILGNFVGVSGGVTYDGVIYANAQLELYPAGFGALPAKTPDLVIGLPGNSGPAALYDSSSTLSQTLTLPTNIESAWLDVIAQSQSNDEFWYLCVPDDLADELYSCGGTGLRETEVSIDGQPAGVAPVYPWIFTGGIDPYLWEPIPDVQTLNFKPYRVDLTPFAGLLSDGQPHTVALSVFNADSYFAVTANLLLGLDHGSRHVTGAVLTNNLKAPSPVITSKVNADAGGNVTGPVTVSSHRAYSISGYVNTSHGPVETTVSQDIAFSNTQTFTINETVFDQNLRQSTTVTSRTITRAGPFVSVAEKTLSYPLSFDYDEVGNDDGSFSVISTSDQSLLEADSSPLVGPSPFPGPLPILSSSSDHVASQDTLSFSAAGAVTGHTGASTQSYVERTAFGGCYSRTLTARDNVLTGVKDGAGCPPGPGLPPPPGPPGKSW